MNCPFCNENEFDIQGLRHHLQCGYCPEFKTEQPSRVCGWWCTTCKVEVPSEHVAFGDTHDPRAGGCGNRVI